MADVTSPFGFPYPENTDLVRDGASDIESLAEAVNDQFAAGFQYAGTRYYTSSGSFAKADPLGTGDIGLRAIRVRVVGAGGGGGGATATGSGESSFSDGGAGGGYVEKFYLASELSASETVTRGAGGAGGSAANGTAGGNSTFKGLTAGGGEAGRMRSATTSFNIPAVSTATVGGTATGGDVNIDGKVGNRSLVVSFGSITGGVAGQGGDTVLGTGGETVVSNGNGSSGTGFGSGGSGGRNSSQNEAATRTGGSGQNGAVIIDCFV